MLKQVFVFSTLLLDIVADERSCCFYHAGKNGDDSQHLVGKALQSLFGLNIVGLLLLLLLM